MKQRAWFISLVFVIMMLMGGQHLAMGGSGKAGSLSGKVVESMESGRYTYVCLEKAGKKTWVAVPQMKVVKGKEMSFQPGIEMVNFESKSLNRTFDKIYFSAGPVQH